MARDYLNDLELLILLAILRVGEQAYALSVAREIEHTAGRTVLLGALYVAVDRLEEKGLIASSYGDPTPERGGRAKRYFRVTRKGLAAVRATKRGLMGLWAGIPELRGGVA